MSEGEETTENGLSAASLSLEQMANLQKALDNMAPEEVRKLEDAAKSLVTAVAVPPMPAVASTSTPTTKDEPSLEASKPVETPVASPSVVSAVADEDDPYPAPEGMGELKAIAFLWSMEAIESTRYVHRGVTKYRPIEGLLLGRLDESGSTILQFLVQKPCVAATATGKIVNVPKGHRLMAAVNHSLRRCLPLCLLNGCAYLWIQPIGYQTSIDGSREMLFDIRVESDPIDPTKPNLISLESAMGRIANAKKAA